MTIRIIYENFESQFLAEPSEYHGISLLPHFIEITTVIKVFNQFEDLKATPCSSRMMNMCTTFQL